MSRPPDSPENAPVQADKDDFVTAPVPAPSGRPSRAAWLGTAVATAVVVLLAVLVAGWLSIRARRPAAAAAAPAERALSARAVRARPPAVRWHGVLALPGRSPQAAVLLLRRAATADAGADTGYAYSLYATTWLARGRASLDSASGALRLDGRVRLVRQRDAGGAPTWRAVAPWNGELREVPR